MSLQMGATISACEKGAQWHRALELFEVMRNIITYNAAIGACEKGAQWHDVPWSSSHKWAKLV